jgi:hypothetical protein
MPPKRTSRGRPKRTTHKKTQKESSGFASFLQKIWGGIIWFLKMYVPTNPDEIEGPKKTKPRRKRKYVATKRT